MKRKSTEVRFQLYRYQILPISQHLQLEIGSDITSFEDLVAKKNDLFAAALASIETFSYSRADLVHRVILQKDDLIVMRVGVNRDIRRETREFTTENIDNWPNLLIAFRNSPNIQKLAVELNYKAFKKTNSLVAIIERNLNQILRADQLNVRFMPMFEKHQFWEVVERYSGQITQIEFQMISPNLPSISQSLEFDLKSLNRATNTQETHLQLNSDKDSHLVIEPDNSTISSLVEYTSQGGGNISLKVKGLSRKIHTENSVTETSIDEVELTSSNESQMEQILNQLLS